MKVSVLTAIISILASNFANAVECKATKDVNGTNVTPAVFAMTKGSINRGTEVAQASYQGEDSENSIQIFVSDASQGSLTDMVSISIVDKVSGVRSFSLGQFGKDKRFVAQLLRNVGQITQPFITVICNK